MEPPPRFEDLSPQQEVEVFACYWLVAMAPAWRTTLYTFSDFLYDEVAGAPPRACCYVSQLMFSFASGSSLSFECPILPSDRNPSSWSHSASNAPMQTMSPTPSGLDVTGS
jgi:hypothetical protein